MNSFSKSLVSNRRMVKEQLYHVILKYIRENESTSRKDLARKFNLSETMISRVTGTLLDHKLIFERGKGKAGPGGGPRPIYLTFNSQRGYLISVDVGSYEIKCVLTDLSHQILMKKSILTPEDGVLAQMVNLVKEIVNSQKSFQNNFKGISVGIAGLVDQKKGKVIFSANIPSLNGLPLKSILAREFQKPVVITNSTIIKMIGERYFGDVENKDHFMVISWGNGIGLTVVLPPGEEIIFGQERGIWDFGHITVNKNGPLCTCGKRGCLETYCAGWALVKEVLRNNSYRKMTNPIGKGGKIDMNVIVKAAQGGSSSAKSLLKEAGRIFGQNLAFPVQFFSPREIIFSGKLIQTAQEFLMGPLKTALRARIDDKDYRSLKIKISTLDKFGGALGGTKLISHELFKAPLVHLVGV